MKAFRDGHWVIEAGADATPPRDAVEAKQARPARKVQINGRWITEPEPAESPADAPTEPSHRRGHRA